MRTKFGCALVFLSVLVAGHPARATVPDLLPVQGLITDQAGKALDGNKDVVFSLYSKKEGGTALWKEQWTNDNAVVFEDGFFTVYLGSVTSLPIDNLLDSEKLWLGIQIAGDTEMERLELASVPFALEAEVCRQIGQLTEDKIQTKLIGPSGASAAGSCNGTDKVKGIDPATGQILCGEDVAQAGSGGGTLTDVTGTSPIAVTGSGGVRNIAITENAFAAYSHSHTGYLSSAPDAVTTTNIANGTLLAEDFASIGNCSSICTDANTIYTAGTGLSLTGTTFSVSSITSTMITDGEITAADLGALDYMQLKNSGIYPKASTTTAANWNYIESGGPDCTGTNAGAVRRIRLGTSLSWRDCLCFCGGYSPVQAGINPYKWHCLCT